MTVALGVGVGVKVGHTGLALGEADPLALGDAEPLTLGVAVGLGVAVAVGLGLTDPLGDGLTDAETVGAGVGRHPGGGVLCWSTPVPPMVLVA